MGKYNTIAVIYGSDSSEWEVACRSGEFTASRIDATKYDVYEIFARFGHMEPRGIQQERLHESHLPGRLPPRDRQE